MKHSRLISALKENKIFLSQEVMDHLISYYDLTLKWSEKMNLTANLTARSYLCENILDPILALFALKNFVSLSQFRIFDVGCGGGFTGMTWSILDHNLDIRFIDSDRRKISFCKSALNKFDLPISNASWCRFSNSSSLIDLLSKNAACPNLIVSRATFGAESFLETLRSLSVLNIQGVYHLSLEEVDKWKKNQHQIIPYTIQFEDQMIKRALIVFS